MILLDANILIYATNAAAPECAVAKPWLEEKLNGRPRVGLSWVTILAFVRLASNPMVTRGAVTPAEAWRRVSEEWLVRPNVWIPEPGSGHAAILGRLLAHPAMTSRKVTDAHLAALAIEHGLTLCSTDGDFSLFKELRWENPLR